MTLLCGVGCDSDEMHLHISCLFVGLVRLSRAELKPLVFKRHHQDFVRTERDTHCVMSAWAAAPEHAEASLIRSPVYMVWNA